MKKRIGAHTHFVYKITETLTFFFISIEQYCVSTNSGKNNFRESKIALSSLFALCAPQLNVNCWQIVTIETDTQERRRRVQEWIRNWKRTHTRAGRQAKINAISWISIQYFHPKHKLAAFKHRCANFLDEIIAGWWINVYILYMISRTEQAKARSRKRAAFSTFKDIVAHKRTHFDVATFVLDFISIVRHIHIFSWTTEMTKCKSCENMCHKHECCYEQ